MEALLPDKRRVRGARCLPAAPCGRTRRRHADALSVVLRTRDGHGRHTGHPAVAAGESHQLRSSADERANGRASVQRSYGTRVGRMHRKLAAAERQNFLGIFPRARTRHLVLCRSNAKVFLHLLQVSFDLFR